MISIDLINGSVAYIASQYLSESKPEIQEQVQSSVITPETQEQTQPQTETYVAMVWIPQSGAKYHSRSGCSNMKNPS